MDKKSASLSTINSLLFLAKKLLENNIEWYIFGSVGDAIVGVDIVPHGYGIIYQTKYYSVSTLHILRKNIDCELLFCVIL